MAETYGPFDTANWTQSQWFEVAQTWAPSGVIGLPQPGTTAGPLGLSSNGLTLTLAVGSAWVRGAGYKNDAGKTFTVTANANSTLSRRDRIVLRRDLAAKTVTAIRLQGTAANPPVAPALTQSETGQWDMPLFSFLVPPNSGTLISGYIDERPWASADYDPIALPPTTGWSAELSTNYGAPTGRIGGDNRVDLSGMFRRDIVNSSVAEGGTLFGFTTALPAALRPTGPRLIGLATTPAGVCEIYYQPGATFAKNGTTQTSDPFCLSYSFRVDTTVYNTANWYLSLNSLNYYL